jgi:TonB family protein
MPSKIVGPLAAGALTLIGAAFGSAAIADTTPAWAEAPSIADIAAAYPPKARAAKVSGHVELTCEIGRDGHPRDCDPLQEKPFGYAFGAAARKLAEKLKAADPAMVGQNVFVPVSFDAWVLGGQPHAVRPAWVELPTLFEFQLSFPKTDNGVNHIRVVLGCTVETTGALGGCTVADEDPPGRGYGAAALALTSKFRVSPWGPDGEPAVGARVQVPIRYDLTGTAPGAAKP